MNASALTFIERLKAKSNVSHSSTSDELPIEPSLMIGSLLPPQPCDICGCPIVWQSAYSDDWNCGECSPWPAAAMVRRKLSLVLTHEGFAWEGIRPLDDVREGCGGQRAAAGRVGDLVGPMQTVGNVGKNLVVFPWTGRGAAAVDAWWEASAADTERRFEQIERERRRSLPPSQPSGRAAYYLRPSGAIWSAVEAEAKAGGKGGGVKSQPPADAIAWTWEGSEFWYPCNQTSEVGK